MQNHPFGRIRQAKLILPQEDEEVQTAWQEQVAAAAQAPWLWQTLVQHGSALYPRFVAAYGQLQALPRRVRRALRRRLKQPLAGVALLLALGQEPALAARITVTTRNPAIRADGRCSLIEALVNANDDAVTHRDCAAGRGIDTITLPAGSTQTLTTVNNDTS